MNDTPPSGAPARLDPIRPTDEEARALARALVRVARAAALATIEAGSGMPAASLVSLATDLDGTPLILISRLAGHTANLAADPRASLLVTRAGKGDPLAHPRATLFVTARRLDRDSPEGRRARARFLARQPKASLYADFPDFGFVALDPIRASLNGGFGKAYELTRADLLTPVVDPDAFLALAAEAVAHLNADHREALALYATRLLGEAAGAWRALDLDPHGLDLACGERTARLAFPQPAADAGALRGLLRDLADTARAAG